MKIEFSKTALKKLKKYPPKFQKRIIKGMEKLPESGNVKKLACDKLPPLYRLRLGQIRVIFQVGKSSIRIVLIDNRGDVYKKI